MEKGPIWTKNSFHLRNVSWLIIYSLKVGQCKWLHKLPSINRIQYSVFVLFSCSSTALRVSDQPRPFALLRPWKYSHRWHPILHAYSWLCTTTDTLPLTYFVETGLWVAAFWVVGLRKSTLLNLIEFEVQSIREPSDALRNRKGHRIIVFAYSTK